MVRLSLKLLVMNMVCQLNIDNKEWLKLYKIGKAVYHNHIIIGIRDAELSEEFLIYSNGKLVSVVNSMIEAFNLIDYMEVIVKWKI